MGGCCAIQSCAARRLVPCDQKIIKTWNTFVCRSFDSVGESAFKSLAVLLYYCNIVEVEWTRNFQLDLPSRAVLNAREQNSPRPLFAKTVHGVFQPTTSF